MSKNGNDILRLNGVTMIRKNRNETSIEFRLRNGTLVWLPISQVKRIESEELVNGTDISVPRWLLEDRGIFEYD